MKSVLIIGAGISGLVAARLLQHSGFSVVVLEKSRGVGGRMATRRIAASDAHGVHYQGRADHGAQYITVRSERFGLLITELERVGVVTEWYPASRHISTPADMQPPPPRYIGVHGMNSIAKYLAEGLDVQSEQRAVQLQSTEQGWRVHTDKNLLFQADMLMLTAPVPQSLMLIDSMEQELLSYQERLELEGVLYNPCIAMMLALDAPVNMPHSDWHPHGGMRFSGEPLRWVSDNTLKGISPNLTTLTIHTGFEFAREHWETNNEELARLILHEVKHVIGQATVLHYDIHRWRYSQSFSAIEGQYLFVAKPHPLVFAGDGFGGGRTEGAALSGWAAAEALMAATRKE
jgi:renalase